MIYFAWCCLIEKFYGYNFKEKMIKKKYQTELQIN